PPTGHRVDAIETRIGGEPRQQWRRKIRMIKNVEHLSPNLQFDRFGYSRRLEYRKVKVAICGTNQSIPAQASKVLRPCQTGSRAAISSRVKRTGYLERRQIQKVVRTVGSGKRIAYDIRSGEELA